MLMPCHISNGFSLNILKFHFRIPSLQRSKKNISHFC